MSVSGLCHLCERAAAVASCERCGALACAEHFDRERGLCRDCVADVE